MDQSLEQRKKKEVNTKGGSYVWTHIAPLSENELVKFETTFNFRLNPTLHQFILTHNAAKSHQAAVPSLCKKRKVSALLDFTEGGSAWETNRRMRKVLGTRCIVIAMDRFENYICISRVYSKQQIAVWNHVTGELEECTMDLLDLLDIWSGNA